MSDSKPAPENLSETIPTGSQGAQQLGVASDPWTAGILLVKEALRLFGDERAAGPLRKVTQLELELLEELRKPRRDQDDAKVMALRQQIPVLMHETTELLKMQEARKP